MIFNRILILFTILSLVVIGFTLANNTPKEDESENNSIGVMARSARKYVSSFLPTDWEKSSLITNIAMPALFLLFLSSVSNMSAKERATETNSINRKKRSPISGWADNLQNVLTNFQKAIEKMQKFEAELENEINDDSIETIDF